MMSGSAALIISAFMGQPDGVLDEDFGRLDARTFRATIGNNAALDPHRAWYNGIYAIYSGGQEESPFVTSYAGWNLEHYFDARPMPEKREIFFEPRAAPLEYTRIDGNTCELYQPETPYWGVESWTRFTVRDPHYVDFHFACVPHKKLREFLGVFWASYMNGPHNKGMYFLRAGSTLYEPQWAQLVTHEHNRDSTVLSERDYGSIVFDEGGREVLYNNFSPLRFSVPFFYGRWRDKVLIFIFDPEANVRITHSPSGGGRTPDGTDTNPAWEFQFIVPDAKIGERYELRARFVYKDWVSRDDVIEEVRKYHASL